MCGQECVHLIQMKSVIRHKVCQSCFAALAGNGKKGQMVQTKENSLLFQYIPAPLTGLAWQLATFLLTTCFHKP